MKNISDNVETVIDGSIQEVGPRRVNTYEFILKFLSSYLLLIITTVVQLFFLRDLVQICSIFLWWVVLLVFTSSLSKGLNQIGKVQLNWLMAPDPLRRIFFKGR